MTRAFARHGYNGPGTGTLDPDLPTCATIIKYAILRKQSDSHFPALHHLIILKFQENPQAQVGIQLKRYTLERPSRAVYGR